MTDLFLEDEICKMTVLSRAVAAVLFTFVLSIFPLAAKALTIEEAISPLGIMSARLSPDGRHIAMIGFTGGNHGLLLLDVDTWSAKMIVSGERVIEGFYIYNKEPRSVTWVGNDVLAVDYGPRAESIDLKGRKIARIGVKVIGKVDSAVPDSPMVLVYADEEYEELGLANVRTGRIARLRYPMSGRVIDWVFDSHGELRALTLADSSFWKDTTTVSNWYKPKGDAQWQKLADFKMTDDMWTMMSVPDKDNTLVIASSMGRDTTAVFSYDTQKREIGDMMAGHPTQDILYVQGANLSEFRSVATKGMKPERYWFDAKWSSVQASVDAVLPGRINVLSGDPAKRVLVFSSGDVDPGRWFLLDMTDLKMREVGAFKSSIDPNRMRPMEILSYKAGDGLAIPAYLTRPAGKAGPAPTVIMIHGGPTVRDEWAWDADVQVLAAHGYAVFQPQFRGSSGFGRKFEQAGYGQWGLAMQDDITAGVEHLIRNGIADPDRICIYGASYGGYAALWGLVKTPHLYRCGISFAGVSDIEYMFKDASDRNSNKIARELMRARIGDIKLNKEQFDSVSPLKHADKIRAPILLMHGDEDERVPISHSEKMKQALDEHRKPYEWRIFEKEGHGLSYLTNLQAFYTHMLAFLDKHIGPVKPAAGSNAEKSAVAPAVTEQASNRN